LSALVSANWRGCERVMADVTGSPAMSVCCGFGDGGLPLSFQIAGKRFADATVLRLGHAYERATPWRDHRPSF
jgi:aspartyl-tRNA(Asn)/glutamyl-tRNA(Gln) amidotransferase subunit A